MLKTHECGITNICHVVGQFPEGIKNDLPAIREEMNKYPDILPAVRDAAYNSYLKAQGIDDGIKNYDRVTMLAHAWRLKSNQPIEK